MGSTKNYEGFNGDELCNDKIVQKEQDKILLQPIIYNRQLFGCEFLSKLSIAFNYWLNIPINKLKIIDESVIMLRDSGLLMDAIENENSSCLRRGAMVAHSIYGVATTINASGYGYFLALEKLFDLQHADTGKIYTEQIMEIHRGQGMDIYWRANFICPTESEYKQMAVRRTGGLFTLIVRLMQLFSDSDKELSRLAALLAVYHQIHEDYCSFCEDITDGKFTIPIIHALYDQAAGRQVSNILRQRTADVDLKKYCVKLLEKLGSFKYTREILLALDRQVRKEVAKIGPNTHMDEILSDLLAWNLSNEESKEEFE